MEFNNNSDFFNSFVLSNYLDEEIEFFSRGGIELGKFWKK